PPRASDTVRRSSPSLLLPVAGLLIRWNWLDARWRQQLHRRKFTSIRIHAASRRCVFGGRHQQLVRERDRLIDPHGARFGIAPLFQEVEHALDAAGARTRTGERR